MKAEYDFSNAKRATEVPHLNKLRASIPLKKRVTIYLDEEVINKFKEEASEIGIKYQTLINLALKKYHKKDASECVAQNPVLDDSQQDNAANKLLVVAQAMSNLTREDIKTLTELMDRFVEGYDQVGTPSLYDKSLKSDGTICNSVFGGKLREIVNSNTSYGYVSGITQGRICERLPLLGVLNPSKRQSIVELVKSGRVVITSDPNRTTFYSLDDSIRLLNDSILDGVKITKAAG